MAHYIEVGIRNEFEDPKGRSLTAQAQNFLALRVTSIRTRMVYKVSVDLPHQELEAIRRALTDPILEESAADSRLALPACHWIIAIGFKPGVTDNVGHTAGLFIADVIERPLPSEAKVFTETLYLVEGSSLTPTDLKRLAFELLANDLIERVKIWPAAEYVNAPIDLELPLTASAIEPRATVIPLPLTDEELSRLSQERHLSLNLAELHAIRGYFAQEHIRSHRAELGLPADPTDVELETIAQTWSEHCKHKIFNARIHYSDETGQQETINSLFKTYIVGPTKEIAKRVDWLVSVFDDNAGVVQLNSTTNLVYKVETHNSPSALDPYGGAITGIVGVNRDPLGTGLGASLLTNVWGYCLASPRYDGPIPEGLFHPRRIREGVHRGVIDGGNQSGIPYSRGFEFFDDRFLGKPLVFCGTVGLMPAQVNGRPSHLKEIHPEDLVVMVGGRIGKDGIHGATFSSEALHTESPAQAVQIGDPITQKIMADMLLEARDRGLYRALTDNGAGGLSSSVGELAQLSGGAELDLDLAPLKYQGLHPWEILLSEAQERMTVAVPAECLTDFLALARQREVEATPIGHFTDHGRFHLRYRGQVVGDLDLAFLHGGCPTMELEAQWTPVRHLEPPDVGIDLTTLDCTALLGALLGNLNLGAKATKYRQYDHEVKGLSVIKPLIGLHGDIPADATVMRALHGRPEAILLAEGIAPRISDIDPAAMAAYVVDLAVRRVIAAGGKLGQIAGLDNFCWPDPVQSAATPDGKYKMAGLVRACKALAEMTCGLTVPCISGKDSMKNDSTRGGVKISIPPTLLFSTLGWINDASKAIDCVPAQADEVVYVLGETHAELGASELFAHLATLHSQPDLIGNRPPHISPGTCQSVCSVLQQAIEMNLVRSAQAPHFGGLGVGLAMFCLASNLGLAASLDEIPVSSNLCPAELLFAESGSRFLVTVAPDQVETFEQLLRSHPMPWARLGEMRSHPALHLRYRGNEVVDCSLTQLGQYYREKSHAI